jgi:Chitobiase/beta-hexosaminidase C-terminal domain/FG-GAP-like repeat
MRAFPYRSRELTAFAMLLLLIAVIIEGCSGASGAGGGGGNSSTQTVVATPTFTPSSGTSFSSTLSVSIAESTSGATIYYTTNGSAPTTSSTVYSVPFTISATTTVNAMATAAGDAQSAMGSASYTLAGAPAAAATPTFSPASGTTFSSTLSVSIADTTPGATIYYTTNGTTPTTSSSVYSGAFTITASTTVHAIASASATGFTQSAVGAASYTLASPTPAATPTFTPPSGSTFSSTDNVTITDTTPGATIYYTTNGTMPTTSSSVYSGPIVVSATTTINAIATASGYTQSALSTASYTLIASTGGVVSDNFDETALNSSLWTVENPLGDGTITMNGSAATLNVPMGTTHDLTAAGDNALRIMQPISNSDFSVDVRFQSAVEIGNQDEGILVEQDSGDFLRFDVLFDGNDGPELFAAGISGGNFTNLFSTHITLAQAPLFLRLARTGNLWTGSWSTDGITFTAAPSFTFNLNVAEIGPYAGTYALSPVDSPSFTAIVDYFFATSNPIANLDGPLPYGYATVDANPPGTLVEKTLADIQGTGQLEPVIGLEEYSTNGPNSNGGVYWYSYPTSGGVQGTWVRHAIIDDGNAYEDMTPLDVNGDGAMDIVASYDNTSGVYQIVWFENPRGSGGDPTQPWVEHVIGPGYGENNLQIADIDGDGKLDVVTPSSVFFQNSADSWTQVMYSPSFRGVALLDIGSGHGAINLAGTGPSPSFNVVWYENPRETGGNARTGTWVMHYIGPTPYPCGENNCQDGGDVGAYNAMDVNGDNMMDVISGQSEGPLGTAPPPGGLEWWQAPTDRRNGTWIKHTIDANMIDVHKIAIGDMNKDGNLDIIIAEQDQAPLRRVVVYYDDGKGNLTPEIISNAEGHNICVGNVMGNPGELDILNSGHGYYLDSHPLQIFLNPY